jgi:putative tryptophan/tyrosine transport system substrate-binding protein
MQNCQAQGRDVVIYYAAPALEPFQQQMIRIEKRLREKSKTAFQMKFAELPRFTHEMNSTSLESLIAPIVASNPLVIITPSMDIAKIVVDKNIPVQIVISGLADPLTMGIIQNVAGHRVNVTGYSHFLDLDEKRLSILKEISPKSVRIGILLDRTIKEERIARNAGRFEYFAEKAAIVPFEVRSTDEAVSIISKSKKLGIDSWLIYLMPINYEPKDAKLIVDAVRQLKLPAIYETMKFIELGGLVSYQPVLLDPEEIWIRDLLLLLDGVPAKDIPLERPRHFFLTINTEEASRLGLTISPNLMRRVDLTFPCSVKLPTSCTKPLPKKY